MKRTMRGAVALVVVLGAIAAVLGANIVLLGYADGRSDPVGTLSPRVTTKPKPFAPPAPPAYEDD